LAALSPEASGMLSAWGVDRLFRTFETTEKAAESFQRRTAFLPSSADRNAAVLASENAA
jgi:hypothetical protein